MPPFKYKPPFPVRLKAPKGRINPLNSPDIFVGKSIVANSPHRITAQQLEEATRLLKKKLGKTKEFFVNVHATYPVTRKPEGTKQGQGKGDIDRFVSRAGAGRTLFYIPTINPFEHLTHLPPQYGPFKGAIGGLPMPCHFRTQYNHSKTHNLDVLTKNKKIEEEAKLREIQMCKLKGLPLPSSGLESVQIVD